MSDILIIGRIGSKTSILATSILASLLTLLWVFQFLETSEFLTWTSLLIGFTVLDYYFGDKSKRGKWIVD